MLVEFAFDVSGHIKQPNAAELAEADQEMDIITFNRAVTSDGTPCYAYVAVKPSRFQEFQRLTSAGTPLVYDDYGTVIASGYGSEPLPEVIEDMRRRYGIDDQLEEKLAETAKQQQKAFLERPEEERLKDIVDFLKNKPNGTNGSAG